MSKFLPDILENCEIPEDVLKALMVLVDAKVIKGTRIESDGYSVEFVMMNDKVYILNVKENNSNK